MTCGALPAEIHLLHLARKPSRRLQARTVRVIVIVAVAQIALGIEILDAEMPDVLEILQAEGPIHGVVFDRGG